MSAHYSLKKRLAEWAEEILTTENTEKKQKENSMHSVVKSIGQPADSSMFAWQNYTQSDSLNRCGSFHCRSSGPKSGIPNNQGTVMVVMMNQKFQ